ncbi:MAG: hypothetical protein EPO02_13265 [Nitrospirae bacterium]|nr:MAG: hypothetical protein EPO02_13265 [Nitrospirota bacterium]
MRVGNYWHMLPKAVQARRSLWEAIDPKRGKNIVDLSFPDEICTSKRDHEMMVKLRCGSTWQVVGSDSYEHLLGAPPLGIVFSEFAMADPQCWPVLEPILMENNGWAIFISTPRGKNAFHRIFELAKKEPKWYAEEIRADQTGVFTAEQLDDIKRGLIAFYGSEEQGTSLFQQEYMVDWESAILGAYYAEQIRRMQAEGRITPIPIDRGVRVHTSWDLGRTNATAIWFWQCVGRERRAIDYYESSGAGLDHYATVLHDKRHEHKWVYGEHYLPHDIKITELTTNLSRQATLESLGVAPINVVKEHNILDGINAVQRMMDRTWIDPVRCARGLEALKAYRKEWDDTLHDWKKSAYPDWSNHGADAFRYFAAGYDDPVGVRETTDRHRQRFGSSGGRTHWSA